MWTVTFYLNGEPIAEIDIAEAKNKIYAIVQAAQKLPATLDRADDVDAVEIPEGGE